LGELLLAVVLYAAARAEERPLWSVVAGICCALMVFNRPGDGLMVIMVSAFFLQAKAIGITGFTLPTMYRWIRSDRGRAMTTHPFMHGRYTGSGPARAVIAEAGPDGESQFRRIAEYVGKMGD
jgi:hypothetical protein